MFTNKTDTLFNSSDIEYVTCETYTLGSSKHKKGTHYLYACIKNKNIHDLAENWLSDNRARRIRIFAPTGYWNPYTVSGFTYEKRLNELTMHVIIDKEIKKLISKKHKYEIRIDYEDFFDVYTNTPEHSIRLSLYILK